MSEDNNMSFLQHLEELRWRLVRAAIAVIIAGIVIWIYQVEIIEVKTGAAGEPPAESVGFTTGFTVGFRS